jgi:predicted dehydrogenase
MEFEKGNAVFTCSTQLANHQYAKIFGTKGKIEIENPFTPSINDSVKILLYKDEGIREFLFEPCDQYTLQGDIFSQAIINDTDVFTPFSDAVANMKVIDKIFESGKTGKWIEV